MTTMPSLLLIKACTKHANYCFSLLICKLMIFLLLWLLKLLNFWWMSSDMMSSLMPLWLKWMQLKLWLRQCLHECGFICNGIDNDAVMPSVYMTPTETICKTGSIWKHCQKWSFFKNGRFIFCVNSETTSISFWGEICIVWFKMANLVLSAVLTYTITTLIFWWND